MKNTATLKNRLAAMAVISVLLLCGCSGGSDWNGDIDLVGDLPEQDIAPVTTTTLSNAHTVTTTAVPEPEVNPAWCYIAPYEESEWFESLCGKGEYVPGYIYYGKEKHGGNGKLRVLLEKKFKDGDETNYQTNTMIYAVSLEDEVVEVDKRYGSYRVLYTAQYGSVDILACSDRVGDEEARLVYVSDGDYIVQIDKETGEYTLPVHSDNGVSKIYCQGTWLDVETCQYCVYDKDYIIWADSDENWFWYHPEVDKNEPMTKKWNYLAKADPDWTIGEEVEFSYPPLTGKTGWVQLGYSDEDAMGYRDYGMEPGYLYFVQGIYGANHQYYLLLPIRFKDYPCYLYQSDNYVCGVTEDNRLLKVDKRDGSYEVLYTAQNGSISSMDFRGEVKGNYPKQYWTGVDCLIFSAGSSIMRYDLETEDFTVIESHDVNVDHIECLDWKRIKQNSADYYDFSYICEECAYDPEHFIWCDVNGDWFWYHPDRGESTPLDYDALMRNY